MKQYDLTGKVALVTGASYGIGFAIAKGLASAGATIVFNDRREELVEKGIEAYKEEGIKAYGYVCDVTDEDAVEELVAYAAAKGGLKMLTKNIASEFGEHNIQCNGIGPGYIATPQTAPLREKQADGSRHPFDSFIIAKTPAARWGEPEDLAGPAVFLASDASNFVNGHILYVDGGILAYIGKQP